MFRHTRLRVVLVFPVPKSFTALPVADDAQQHAVAGGQFVGQRMLGTLSREWSLRPPAGLAVKHCYRRYRPQLDQHGPEHLELGVDVRRIIVVRSPCPPLDSLGAVGQRRIDARADIGFVIGGDCPARSG